jgi:hypothetical protein
LIPVHFCVTAPVSFFSTVLVCMLNRATIITRGGPIWWLLFTYASCIKNWLMHNNFCRFSSVRTQNDGELHIEDQNDRFPNIYILVFFKRLISIFLDIISTVKKRLISIKIYVCSLVRFISVLKNQSEIWYNPVVFEERYPNTSNFFLFFFTIFSFFGMVCDFYLY